MYRPAAYVVDDVTRLHQAISAYPFATIARATDSGVQFAYAPVVLDATAERTGAIRFHLARANPVSSADGEKLYFSFKGPDTYISPDWYRTPGLVPTWNYVAVEGSGNARRLDAAELRSLLIALSEQEESRLAPKKPWTIDKVPEERISTLMNAIVGFHVTFELLEGKFKLSQDKNTQDVAGVLEALERSKRQVDQAVVRAMREAVRR